MSGADAAHLVVAVALTYLLGSERLLVAGVARYFDNDDDQSDPPRDQSGEPQR